MVEFDPIPMIKSIQIKLGKLKLNACCSLHEIEMKVDIWMIKLHSKLNKLIESNYMSFMNGNKLRVNMHASDEVNLNLPSQLETNCMFIPWNRIGRKHVLEFDLNLIWWIKSIHAFPWWNQFESNLTNWS
jgi:hypothetical protein